jgi:hypothetical protein
MILAAAGFALATGSANAAITDCPTFTTNITNGMCIDKSPHFDERSDQAGYIYCSPATDGTPNGEIQVDKYIKKNGSSLWKGSCKVSCSNLNAWPLLLTLPTVTGALCP